MLIMISSNLPGGSTLLMNQQVQVPCLVSPKLQPKARRMHISRSIHIGISLICTIVSFMPTTCWILFLQSPFTGL